MANMSYCRFANTVADLQDCCDHMDEPDLSASEQRARRRLIQTAVEIALNYGDEVNMSVQATSLP